MLNRRIIPESKHTHGADLNIKVKARELRKKMTDTERILWNHLKGGKMNGMHFRRQHPYGIYILDFFCYKANLAIEIDGEIHKFKKEYDYLRSKYLEDTGLTVIRFSNSEISENLKDVLKRVKDYL